MVGKLEYRCRTAVVEQRLGLGLGLVLQLGLVIILHLKALFRILPMTAAWCYFLSAGRINMHDWRYFLSAI